MEPPPAIENGQLAPPGNGLGCVTHSSAVLRNRNGLSPAKLTDLWLGVCMQPQAHSTLRNRSTSILQWFIVIALLMAWNRWPTQHIGIHNDGTLTLTLIYPAQHHRSYRFASLLKILSGLATWLMTWILWQNPEHCAVHDIDLPPWNMSLAVLQI